MTTIKAYTDLEQSKKLAEILPVESADMCWCNSSIRGIDYIDPWHVNTQSPQEVKDIFDSAFNSWNRFWQIVPAWSLAALLDYLKPDVSLEHDEGEGWSVKAFYIIEKPNSILQDVKEIKGFSEDNPVDACFEMIIKLHEQKLL